MRYPVTIRVEAEVGPILARLAPPTEEIIGGGAEPDYACLPWAVLARCEVTFWFGRRCRSKTLKARRQFHDDAAPTTRWVDVAVAECRSEIVEQLSMHGIAVALDHPWGFDWSGWEQAS